MQCSCEIEIDSDVGPTFYSEEMRTARKQHKCTECRRTIEPGEEYESVSGLWEGGWSKYKTCRDCLSLRNVFFTRGWEFRGLWALFQDNFCYIDAVIPESCISELTPAARAKVCELIESGWDDYDDEEQP